VILLETATSRPKLNTRATSPATSTTLQRPKGRFTQSFPKADLQPDIPLAGQVPLPEDLRHTERAKNRELSRASDEKEEMQMKINLQSYSPCKHLLSPRFHKVDVFMSNSCNEWAYSSSHLFALGYHRLQIAVANYLQ
jgi:hypothetical protein